MRKSKNRYFDHIFVSPGYAPWAITLATGLRRRQSSWLHKLRSVFWLLMGQQRLIRQLTAAYRFTSTVAAADVLGLCWVLGIKSSN